MQGIFTRRGGSWMLLVLPFLFLLLPAVGRAEDPDCLSCHGELAEGASVHAAVSMGCTVCHSGVDASDVPHLFTTRNPKGLGSKLRDICYDCHDRTSFTKNVVHGAIMLGCTSCHNPHRSGHSRLLIEDVPALCMGCHRERFTPGADGSHAFAGNEACLRCHVPHVSDRPKLLSGPAPGTVSKAAEPPR